MQNFTEREVQFLLEARKYPEYRNGVRGEMRFKELRDLREMGCPDHVFEAMLGRRAAALGNVFKQFRAVEHYNEKNRQEHPNLKMPSLEDQISAEKLF